jgi:hypothetical protein
MNVFRALALLLTAAACLPAQNSNPDWSKLEFLLGNWTGTAGGKDTAIGAGRGAFSFELQLNQKIIVRHNQATYDSGIRHEDLMVIYLDAPDQTPRAVYFDTEGHVTRYHVTFPSTSAATFESDATEPGPKYRLSYWMDHGLLNGRFEIAPPGKEYKTYMSWTSTKN